MIYNGEEFYESKRYDINPLIDRVGGGDSFSGGIIHGLLTKPNQGAALESVSYTHLDVYKRQGR